MTKILSIMIIFFSILNARNNYELELYEKMLPSMFLKTPIKVFVDDQTKELLRSSNLFAIQKTCNKSVKLLIGDDFDNIYNVDSPCKDKPLFSTGYRSFKNNNNSFGAFYWSKGRPQIRFKRNVLDRFNLVLPSNLKKYSK